MRIVFGADHAGVDLRRELAQWASSRGIEVATVGANGSDPYDYPVAADEVAQDVLTHPNGIGVLCCGSGIGVSMRANRYEGVRAALCTSPEMAALAREHNH